MSMLDSFFNKGFKAAKCKTLLKLTIPRIKLLRNRREIQLKQMRRDIAKLLETGQEATARIRVEHIIREENMMASQEVLELFCELIVVRLPIIETQRECPLDLKEAISSVCFAAPRCADLTELLQVQMIFAAKYGREFVLAATELRPDCGVNRQLIELLSVRAPSPEKKLKLLKEIAEEHNLEWDPAASESEFNKSPEDLLNGSMQIVGASKLPLPNEKHDETYNASPDLTNAPKPDSDSELDTLDFPEVPKVSVYLHPTVDAASSPIVRHVPLSQQPESDHESPSYSGVPEIPPHMLQFKHEELIHKRSVSSDNEQMDVPAGVEEDKQFLPFITSPSLSSSFSGRTSDLPPPSLPRSKSEVNVDIHLNLQDVLDAAQNAAETAERAAAAARSAASLAKLRIDELSKKKNDQDPEINNENPFHRDTANLPDSKETSQLHQQDSLGHSSSMQYSPDPSEDHKVSYDSDISNHHLHETQKLSFDSSFNNVPTSAVPHQPQRLPSMDDDPYYSYPNLFTSQKLNLGSDHPSTGRS